MSISTKSTSHTENFHQISDTITERLETARKQFPNRFPKSVIVLPPVNESESGQWEERLRQANESHNDEHVTLIPYYTQEAHWIGVILKFNMAGQLQLAEYFNPVVSSFFDSVKFQKQFAKIYPSSSLLSKILKQHDDPDHSEKLTVENLLTAAEEYCSTKNSSSSVQSLNEQYSSTSTTDSGNHQEHFEKACDSKLEKNSFLTQSGNVTPVKVSLTKQSENDNTFDSKEIPPNLGEHKNVSVLLQNDLSSSVQGEKLDAPLQLELYNSLKSELESKLVSYDIVDFEDLQQQIKMKRDFIESLEKEGKHNSAVKRKSSLSKLEELQLLAERVKTLEPKPTNDEYLTLKMQLESRLKEQDVANVEELQQQIEEKRKYIESLEKEGRHSTAKKRRESLSTLEDLQLFAEKVKMLEPKPPIDEHPTVKEDVTNNEYLLLKAEMESRLAANDISDELELEKQIIKKREEIESLENAKKYSVAQKRKVSLSELEQLQLLVEKVKALEPKSSDDEYQTLNEQLENSLREHDINDVEDLQQQIKIRKEFIESLEKEGRQNTAQRRRDSLSKLEDIQILADRVKAMKPKTVEIDHSLLQSTSSNNEYQALKEQLENSLREHDIKDVGDLQQQIKTKKECIESLEKQGKHITAEKRKHSLSELEDLQLLARKVEVLEQKLDPHPHPSPTPYPHPSTPPPPRPHSPDLQEKDNSITKESLIDLQNDFNSLPICSERHIIGLLFYVSVKLAHKALPSAYNIRIPEDIEKEIMYEIESLKQQLKIEELQSSSIHNIIDSCNIHIRNGNWRSALIELRKLWKQISPLDMQELRRLVGKVDDAANLIKDQDIILLIGGTGAGKSTTIHFLGGSKMVETTVNNLNHIAPTEIKNLALKQVATAPSAISITRYINPIPVSLQDIGGHGDTTIILCDSPGFEDTSGAEVDIANGIGIVKAIKGCKSVKPVVLVSYKSIGDRCTGVKDLAHILVGLLPSIKDHMKAFTYLFTKFPPKERSAIHAMLKDIDANLTGEEKSDISFTSILTDMITKTRRGAKVVDPINDNPLDIIDDLVSSAAISYPEEVFHFSISEKSKGTVQEHVRKDQIGIMSATKRSDYSYIQYKLNQLKYLDDLLHQDYIKQIYDDSIGFVSKHLLEEYHNGTATLHRCLMNQTILSSDEIEQYQTCIKHAEDAEELRTKHLSQDVVHSSAYVQYLKQLVRTLSTDLKEKDINDTLVKINLDKIKLLTTFFPDFTKIYNDVHQEFAEKIDLVTNSFKKSVQSNEFVNSASYMTKLNSAIITLDGHFARENLEEKYKDLKVYFLNYLSESTRKFDETFNRKLDKTDIENLNRCVCMLDSVDKAFTLHFHIPRETINVMYEELSLKILDYFNGIIEKIDAAVKKKTDLSTLEQFMTELDAIRTISGFDTKTTQSYFSTLEKLIGYINECRRDAEKLLLSLFRQEKVDFNKLISSLTGLKSAQWIEKYRTGVYSDVISNVEKQILDELELLKTSVMQTNLDLDSADKIQNVYQIIVHINEMKRLDRFFPSIGEQVNIVNGWFMKVTNDVFGILKNTFNAEKWKEQGYQTLDFNKVEKGLNYLYICKEIPILFESDCMSSLNNLEEFIRYFSSFVKSEMASHFEKIKQQKEKNQDDIFEKARLLASRLQEVAEIEAKHKPVFAYFINKQIVEDWRKDLSSYLNDLLDEMKLLSHTNRVEDLNAKLSIAKALSKLDSFMKDRKFIDVYKEYQDIFFANTDDVCKRAIDAISKNDYDLVASEMAALQRSDKIGEHFLKQARRAINFGLNTLIEETKNKAIMLGYDIEKEEIISIVANLKKLQKAKQFISEYLEAPDDIDACIIIVKNLIIERMNRFIQGVKALITVNNFYEADKKIDSITLVRSLLGIYCTKEVSDEIDKLKTSQSDVVLKEIVTKYTEIDISKYTLHPPTDIFAKFGEVNNTNPIYNQASKAIKEAILTKFRQELDSAKSEQPPSIDNIHIRKFESAVKYLPKDMKESLEDELKHCKEDIEHLQRVNNNRLKNACDSGDLKMIRNILEEYKTSDGMKFYFNQGRDRIMKNAQDIVAKIKQCFEENDTAGALENVKILHEYRMEFQHLFTDIRQPYSDGQKQIKNVFHEAYLCFLNRFLESNATMVTDDVVKTVEASFVRLFEFMKFSIKNKDIPDLNEMLTDGFEEKIKTLNEKMARYFKRCEQKYKKSLKPLDVYSLKEVLDEAKQWNSLIVKMKSSYNTYHNYDDSMKAVCDAITTLNPFPQILESISREVTKLGEVLTRQTLVNDETKGFSKQRDEFYEKLNKNFAILSKAKEFSNYNIKLDVKKVEQECLASLENQIKEISTNAENSLGKFLKDARLERQEYDNFNINYNNMISFRKEMREIKSDINQKIESLDCKIFDKIQSWEKMILIDGNIESIKNVLINMKRMSNNFSPFKVMIHEEIDRILAEIKNSKKHSTTFGKLGILLNQDETGIGQSIVAEHKAFQGYSLSLFNEKTQKHGIDYVLDYLQGDLYDRNKLKKRYDEFHTIYGDLIKQYLKPTVDLNPLIADTKLLAGDIKQQPMKIEWDANLRSKIPKLAAHVFALWTLQNAHHYFEAAEVENRKSYLLQPHAAQVVSIFRMLGIGDDKEELKNNLVQIGTGEGKSVTLGATASILALLGFDVCCACYSEYLSQRDYASFLPLFDSLGVLSNIHYGTFNKLCEYIINEDGDIRQVVEQLILKDSNIAVEKAKIAKRAKILLIDEVDVFFSRDFYGNVYTPSASLRDPTITALVNSIWAQRKSKLTLNKVTETQEYKNCCARFSKWESLIQEAIKDMVADVMSFESHNYVVKDDKIGYIEQDNIIYNVVYGYKTLFAYYLENEKGQISKKSLDEKICFTIKCGGFSYAETPLQFQYIMGVTGTLVTLSEPEKAIIKNVYKIHKQTITPSVFGKNNLTFTKKDDIRIETSDDYFNVIKREIDDRLAGKTDKRAVLVFLESEKKLKEFYTSQVLKQLKDFVIILTEEASPAEKENIIKRATGSGQITLFTKTFGRGTDFICHDPNVNSNGGIHVIQTFLSEEVSEEVQIKGRTARQGDYGSYSLILLDKDLEKFRIERTDIENVKDGKGIVKRWFTSLTNKIGITDKCDSVYDLLDDRRMAFFKTQYEDNIKYVEQAKNRHDIGQKFLSSLKSGNTNAVREFLVQENKGVEGTSSSRTICLMDATGSMSHLLQKSKNTVGVMFERAAEILKENNISSDSFELQFAVYRNYSSGEDKILQFSPWETKPDNLRAFMNTINVDGGQGNEAIEVGLWHANKEHEKDSITQVILIGDAPPNTKTEVNAKRASKGENYWKPTKFAQSTYYEDELAKLISMKIPVHAFYVENRAQTSFQQIASQTEGTCTFLDINSTSGSDTLTDLVTKEILRNIGGSSKGNALVKAYVAKFEKSYT